MINHLPNLLDAGKPPKGITPSVLTISGPTYPRVKVTVSFILIKVLRVSVVLLIPFTVTGTNIPNPDGAQSLSEVTNCPTLIELLAAAIVIVSVGVS